VIKELDCGNHNIMSLAFSRDGKRLAVGSKGGPVLLFQRWTDSDRPPAILSGHDAIVWGLDFTPDGRRLASAGLDRSVRLWNCLTGNELLSLRTHAEWNYNVAFTSDGASLAHAGGKGTTFGSIHIIDADRPQRDVQITP